MNDGVKLTSMAIREQLMEYFKGGADTPFARNKLLRWHPINTPGRQYNYRQTRDAMQQQQGLALDSHCLVMVSKNPDTANFCVDTFKGSAIMQEIQSDMVDVFKKYLRGVKVKYEGKGDKVGQTKAKQICAEARYIDQFESPKPAFAATDYDQIIDLNRHMEAVWANTPMVVRGSTTVGQFYWQGDLSPGGLGGPETDD